MSFNFVVGVNGAVFAEEDPILILFDEAHGQYFNRTLYSQALSDLEELGMQVEFNTEDYNSYTFEGVDILIMTDPQESITFKERIYIRDYLLEEKSMLLLANPLVETNESLDGHGDYLNYMLNENELGVSARFWTDIESSAAPKPADIVKNDFLNAGKPEYLILNINDTTHEIFSDYENVSTIVTSSCSIDTARDVLIEGSTEAYADPPLGDPHAFSTSIAIFTLAGNTAAFNARIAMGGSTIMFSDVEDPFLGSSWYEAEDNSKLWRNIISWLSTEIQEENIQKPNTDLYLPFLFGLMTLAAILLVGGITLYMVGSGQQVSVLKVKVVTEDKDTKGKLVETPEDESKKGLTKQTKRERRLRQIQKHTKGDRRK